MYPPNHSNLLNILEFEPQVVFSATQINRTCNKLNGGACE